MLPQLQYGDRLVSLHPTTRGQTGSPHGGRLAPVHRGAFHRVGAVIRGKLRGIPWGDFDKGERRDDVARAYLAASPEPRGVRSIGRGAGESPAVPDQQAKPGDGHCLPGSRGGPGW